MTHDVLATFTDDLQRFGVAAQDAELLATAVLSSRATTLPAPLALRTLRTRRGWSFTECARRARVSVSQMSQYERGKSFPRVRRALRIASLFNVAVADIAWGQPALSEEKETAHDEQ